MAIKTRVMVEGGLAQFVHPKYLRMFGYEALIKLAPPEWEETFNIAIATSKPEPYGKHSTFIYNVLDGPVKKANELGRAGKLPKDREERLSVLLGLLEQGAEKARRDILGTIPEAEVKKRNTSAAFFLILITAVLAFLCATFFHSTNRPPK